MNTGVGCLFLLQGIFLTQGSNLGLPHCRQTLYRLSHQGSLLDASKVMLKNLQVRLQKYVNRQLPDVQVGFRKGRGTRDQIANICWIIKKATEFQKNIYCFVNYAKGFDCVDHNNFPSQHGKFLEMWEYQTT